MISSLTIWKADINIGIYVVTIGVALNVTNDINTNKSEANPPKGLFQHLFTLTQSKHLIQDTFNYVRENVRLYN